MAPSTTLPTPTPDELDDLIYFARTGDTASLKDSLQSLCATHSCAPSTLLASAIDIDADGLGSQSSLLHFAAANGHTDVLAYLLSLLSPGAVHQNGVSANLAVNVEDSSAGSLVDHRNVSGNTALGWAAMNGHLEAVKCLVERGRADVGIRNEAGQDAVFLAETSAQAGAGECVDWLLKNGKGLDSGVQGRMGQDADVEAEGDLEDGADGRGVEMGDGGEELGVGGPEVNGDTMGRESG